MWQLAVSPLELIVRTTIMYALFFGILRIFGKREIGQFTFFDLALILLAANAVQPAVTGPDNSVTGGAIILATIFILNYAVAQLREHVPIVRRILESEPTVIGRDGTWLTDVMEREGLDDIDTGAALREHGLESVDQVKLATLEEDGTISIVPVDDQASNVTRRRRRYRRRV